MSPTEKILDFIGKWIIVVFGIIASVGAFVDMFEIGVFVNIPVVILITILVTGIFLAISKLKRRPRIIIMISVIVLLLILIIILRKLLIPGIYLVSDSVILKYNHYFSDSIVGFFEGWNEDTGMFHYELCTTLLFCIGVTIYSYILVTATWYKVFASIHLLLSVCFVIPGMWLGMMPNSLYMSMLVIYYMACFMHQRNKVVYLARLAGLAVISVIIIGLIFLFSPPASYDAESRYREINRKINEVSAKLGLDDMSMNNMKNILGESGVKAYGGINGGKLGQVGEVEYSETVMLKVRMQQSNHIVYLKGFVGTDYKGREWDSISSANAREIRNFYESYGNRYDYTEQEVKSKLFSPDFNTFAENEKRIISIQHEEDPKNYRFVPYFSDITQDENIKYYYCLRPNSDGEKVYDYTYADLSEEELYNLYSWEEQDADIYSVLRTTNLDVSESVKVMLREHTSLKENDYDATAQGLRSCVEQVREYLKENTEYSLKPGVLGEEEDYVIDFLVNKKKGYCTAYASAATLMLRYMGVPARYVEGYVIQPSSYRHNAQNQDAYVDIDVLDNSAHAWVEVYVPGIGFAPVEMTPGYTEGAGGNGQDGNWPTPATSNPNGQNNTETTTQNKPTTTIRNSRESTDTTRKPGRRTGTTGEGTADGIGSKLVPAILMILIVVIIISVVSYKLYERNKKKYDYHTDDLRYNITVLTAIFERYLDQLEIQYSKNISSEQLAAEITDRVDKTILKRDRQKKKKQQFDKTLQGDQLVISDLKSTSIRVENPHETNFNYAVSEAEELMHLKAKDVRAVLEIINKCKYGNENINFTVEEYNQVREYVEDFKKSLQYLKNKV